MNTTLSTVNTSHVLVLLLREINYGGRPTDAAVAARVFSGIHRTTAEDAVGPRCTSLSRSRNPCLRAACV